LKSLIKVRSCRPQAKRLTQRFGLVALGAACCAMLAAALLGPGAALAEHTRFWKQSDYAQFDKGTAKGVAIRSDGRLLPAPHFAQFADPNLAYLWAARTDSKGRLYVAGGSNAKVIRLDDKGAGTTVFESEELSAQAIVFDAHDNLYVATSPDGKIYKVTAAGQKSVFFEPKTKYIWGLALDSDGTLFAGTGDTAQVFAITPDGKGKVFYKSDERHARSLAIDSHGNLLVGTDPSGLIIRVDVQRKNGGVEAGRAFVLYETDKKEVTALIADKDGSIYASAMGEKSRTPFVPQMAAVIAAAAAQPQAPREAQAGGPPGASPGQVTVTSQVSAAAASQAAAAQFFPTLSGGSEVYKLAPDGSPESLWSSRDEAAYSIALTNRGKVLVGTGNKGKIIELEDNHIYSTIADSTADQIPSLASGPNGVIYVATANPGKVYVLGPDDEKNGSFESEPYDAKVFSQWGRITWGVDDTVAGGRLDFYVRSGNTSRPDENWSAWAGPLSKSGSEPLPCPPARFIQWKAVFAETGGDSPSVSWVSVAYLPKNIAPVIDAIVVQQPGIRLQGGFSGVSAGGAVQVRMPNAEGNNAEPSARPMHIEATPQGVPEKGYRSVIWAAHDENDDDLEFSLYIRGENEKNWRLLKDKLDQRFYSWDGTTLPDGAYYLKVVASDSPSNPPDRALTAERISDRFEVDNTPPAIENLKVNVVGSGDANVIFDAHDSGSTIDSAEYSVDSGDWQVIFPKGQLSDSSQESYAVTLTHLSPGEHTVSARVTNRVQNSASAKATFIVK
jgi:hypothetical protein